MNEFSEAHFKPAEKPIGLAAIPKEDMEMIVNLLKVAAKSGIISEGGGMQATMILETNPTKQLARLGTKQARIEATLEQFGRFHEGLEVIVDEARKGLAHLQTVTGWHPGWQEEEDDEKSSRK